jgi:iron complex outermembrane recepter protein
MLFATAGLTLQCDLAHSQTAAAEATEAGAPDNMQLSEIVVTAQKRVESSQKAAAAITAVSGETLTELGVSNVLQLTNILPAVRFNSENTEMKLFVRGVGTDPGYIWIPESVSVFLNGGFLQRFGSIASLFDIASAQVLPGPQGTLYGRNSIGGTVQITTNRPTHEYESTAMLEYGNYDLLHAAATVNMPVSATLSTRAAFNYEDHHGYQTNGGDSERAYAARFSALWDPNENFSGLLWAQYWQNDFHNAFWQNLPYPDPRNPWYVPPTAPSFAGMPGEVTLQPLSQVHTTTLGGQFDWHFADMTLSYIPFGYNFNTDEYRPVDGYNLPWKSRIDEYSQELRLSSDSAGKLTWLGGLTWLKSDGQLFYTFGPNLAGYDGTTDLNSYAGYAQATYAITDSVRETVGVRYSWDEVSAPNSATISTDGFVTGDFSPIYTPFSFSHDWKHFDWKEGLEADVGEHSMLYGSVQTGYTAGSFNPIDNTANFSNVVQPQTLLAFTLGSKNRFFDNRLQINDEVFYYRYKDLLLSAFSGVTGVSTNYNAPLSTILGDELDIEYQLTSADRLSLALGLLNGKIRDFTTDTGVNYAGYTLPNAPVYTANLGWEHMWRAPSGASVNLRVDSLVSDGYWALYSHNPYTYQSAYTKTGVNLTYHSASDKWSVGVWGRNLENVATLAAAGAGGLPGPSASYIDPPRTYGMRIDVRF